MSIKDQILWHFSNREQIIEGHMLTSVFSDSLLPHVDDLVKLHENGQWSPTIMSSGSPNWYLEFKEYLKSIGVKVVWK
jgi:hypothetical protein